MRIFLPSHVTHYNYVIHYRYLSDSLFSTQLPKVIRTLIFTFAFISFPRIRDLIFFFFANRISSPSYNITEIYLANFE